MDEHAHHSHAHEKKYAANDVRQLMELALLRHAQMYNDCSLEAIEVVCVGKSKQARLARIVRIPSYETWMSRDSWAQNSNNSYMYTPRQRKFSCSKMALHSKMTSGSDQFTISPAKCGGGLT